MGACTSVCRRGQRAGSAVAGSHITHSLACFLHSRQACARPQETRQQARNGEGGLLALLASVAGCILECFYTLIEYLTKFATVMMSITGACWHCPWRSVRKMEDPLFVPGSGHGLVGWCGFATQSESSWQE